MEHIVSFSGGKDSTAMLIEMLERNMQVDRIVFADTLYEFPEMYEYIDKINQYIKKYGDYEIEIIKPKGNAIDYSLSPITRGPRKGEIRGFPLVAFGCSWSRDSKQNPLNKIGKDNISYIGIALDEKHRMVKNWEESGKRYPLIEWRWTEEDCINYLKDKDLINSLYNKFDRTGCWWCPKQSMKSLGILINDYPDKWKELKEWDKKIREYCPSREFKPGYTLLELENKLKQE